MPVAMSTQFPSGDDKLFTLEQHYQLIPPPIPGRKTNSGGRKGRKKIGRPKKNRTRRGKGLSESAELPILQPDKYTSIAGDPRRTTNADENPSMGQVPPTMASKTALPSVLNGRRRQRPPETIKAHSNLRRNQADADWRRRITPAQQKEVDKKLRLLIANIDREARQILSLPRPAGRPARKGRPKRKMKAATVGAEPEADTPPYR
jgi:hypothetical protein